VITFWGLPKISRFFSEINSVKSRDNSLHETFTELDFGAYRIKGLKSFITLSQKKDFLSVSEKKLSRLFALHFRLEFSDFLKICKKLSRLF